MNDATVLLDYLTRYCRGRVNARTAKHIAAETGISPRDQQTIIRDLRRRGHMVGASCRRPMGYYLALGAHEENEVYVQLTSRARDLEETIREMARNRPHLRQLEFAL